MPPTPKRQPSKKPRKHVPALRPDTLKVKLDELDKLNVSGDIKQHVGDILKAAANPDHGKPDVIVKSLPKDRQALINKTVKAVQVISDSVMARGKQRLLDISEDEWQRLVDESIN